MTKKDPRIKKTLLQIDNALLENLSQFPFSKITTDMICRCALVNRSTFYKYYLDKFDLLDNFVSRALNKFRQYANVSFVLATSDTIDSYIYQEIFDKVIQYFQQEKSTVQILWNAEINRDLFKEMIDVVRVEIVNISKNSAEHTEDNFIYTDLYAQLFSSNLLLMIRWWYMHYDSVSEKEVKRLMTANMKDGLFYSFKHIIPESFTGHP